MMFWFSTIWRTRIEIIIEIILVTSLTWVAKTNELVCEEDAIIKTNLLK
jgi:hypothetical protein